jgi:hypothetical protein
MVACLGEEDAVVFHPIDQTVLLGDAAGPDVGAEVAEGFGFADAAEWIAADGFNEFENPEGCLPIRGYPMREIFQEVPVEDEAP